MFFFFFKQKTAYEMRISDWSSDVCSSDLHQVTVDAAIDQLPCVAGTLGGVLDGEGLDLLAPEGVGGFGTRHAFAGARIEDGHGGGSRRQYGQGPPQPRLVGGEVAATTTPTAPPQPTRGSGPSTHPLPPP